MMTLNALRAAHPILAASTTATLRGEHPCLSASTERFVPRVVANRGQTREAVAAELGVRMLLDRAERRNVALNDAATVAIEDVDPEYNEPRVVLAVPA